MAGHGGEVSRFAERAPQWGAARLVSSGRRVQAADDEPHKEPTALRMWERERDGCGGGLGLRGVLGGGWLLGGGFFVLFGFFLTSEGDWRRLGGGSVNEDGTSWPPTRITRDGWWGGGERYDYASSKGRPPQNVFFFLFRKMGRGPKGRRFGLRGGDGFCNPEMPGGLLRGDWFGAGRARGLVW